MSGEATAGGLTAGAAVEDVPVVTVLVPVALVALRRALGAVVPVEEVVPTVAVTPTGVTSALATATVCNAARHAIAATALAPTGIQLE
jgi:spore maturation protein SpmA